MDGHTHAFTHTQLVTIKLLTVKAPFLPVHHLTILLVLWFMHVVTRLPRSPQNELREEMQRYREYLAAQAHEEEQRERELDALVNSEVEKQWGKRVEQWRKEKEARRKLMQDVLDTRKKQIQEKCKNAWKLILYNVPNLYQ